MTRIRNRLPRLAILVTVTGLSGVGAAQPAPPPAPDPPPAPAQPTTEAGWLGLGISQYQAAQFDDCSRTFSELLSPATPHRLRDRDNKVKGRYYYILCLLGQGNGKLADDQIRDAIRENPLLGPDPLIYPKSMVQRYDTIKKDMIKEQEAATLAEIQEREAEQEAARKRAKEMERRLERLRELAAQETVIQKNSRWIASIPFGVGQFQNRDRALGWFFAVSETALLATWLSAVGAELWFTSKADNARTDRERLSNRLDSWRRVNTITGYSFLGVAAIGITEAHLSFEPEFRRTRPRDLPPELREALPPPQAQVKVMPTFSADSRGGQVGLVGRF